MWGPPMAEAEKIAKEGALAAPKRAKSHAHSQRSDSPILRRLFVVGCERSGTTLLTVMLGRHHEIAMMPETHFFLRVVPKEGDRPSTHEEILERYWKSPRAADIGLDAEAIKLRFSRQAPTYANLFCTLLELYAERWEKPLAGEKTPFHLLRVPLILRWFPDARIVCIVRDGRDVVRSILGAPWTAHRSTRRQAWKWTKCARLARRFLHDYPRQFQVIRYEDLVLDPEMVLRRVNAFYGVDFDPAQLDVGGSSPAVPAHERGWKANAVDRPDESRISAWQHHVTESERLIMNSMMGAELRTFGYGDTELPAVSMGRGTSNAILNVLCRGGVYRVVGNICRLCPGAAQSSREQREQGVKGAERTWEEEAEGIDSGMTQSAA